MSARADRSGAGLQAIIAVATVVVCVLIGSRALVIGSVEGRWVFPYLSGYRWSALATSLAGAGAAALVIAGALRLVRDRPAAAVLLAFTGGTAVQLFLWRIYPFAARSIVRSDNATSYFTAATRYDPGTLLRAYESIAPTFPLHAQGNMPGKLLLFQAMHAFTGSPDVMALVILLLGNAVAVLVYLITRDLLDDREVALAALALYLFIPSRLVFAPILNGVTPLPVVLALFLWLRFLRGKGPWLALASGASLFVALLFDPTPLGLGLVFVGGALADRSTGRVGVARIAAGAAMVAATVVACALLFRLATGFDTFRQLARVAAEAERFNVWAGRPYGVWLTANLVEFLITLGVPIVVVVLWGIWKRGPLSTPATWMAVAGSASVLAVDLLGRNRGEVTRLWIFLTVPFAIAAAGFLGPSRRTALLVAVAGLVIQGGTMLAVLGFVIP